MSLANRLVVATARLSVIVAIALTGCSRNSQREETLVVFAPASLRDAFSTLGHEFERAHETSTLVFNFAGTQELRAQLEQGARADAFASADDRHMGELARVGRVVEPVIFARNEPVVVVASEAESTIRSLADLPAARRVVIGASEVPIGRYSLQILDRANEKLGDDFRARVERNVVSRELNARQVLAKVTLGEADAAIVYRTDALSPNASVKALTIPPDINVLADYSIAMVSDAAHPALARDWIAFVTSRTGGDALAAAGFLPAPPTLMSAP